MSETTIQNFRNKLYNTLGARKDALFNLIDALSSTAHRCKSVVELSESKAFERTYSSIQDAITMGAAKMDWEQIQSLIYKQCDTASDDVNCILMDVTNNPRPFASKLSDRSFVHAPNPTPGNKPVCVGHAYSVLAMVPALSADQQKHWLAPIDVGRVPSHKKGNEFGVDQLMSTVNHTNTKNKLTISVGDSLYSTEYCRVETGGNDNIVHISRLNSKRNLYKAATPEDQAAGGRNKIFGHKMSLNQAVTHLTPASRIEKEIITVRGKKQQAIIDVWHDMLFRGSRKYQSKEHAITLVRVELFNENREKVFKRPLWLMVSGKRRKEVAADAVYAYYRSRYDIEHLFRFEKSNLLATSYQTPDSQHEDLWWKIVLLAYVQLFAAREVVEKIPMAWEKYLPQFKDSAINTLATPSQAQRGFAQLLKIIGTPALPCVPRGKLSGRKMGDTQAKRPDFKIVFKGGEKIENKASEEVPKDSDSEKIEKLLKIINKELDSLGVSKKDFVKMLV